MRIDKVEIDGFGKLNNRSYEFKDGLNLIYGKNESGKSTLCEFILSMFYGLPNKGKLEKTDLPARIKYKPWNSEAFGGRVFFTDNSGKKLVIERSFKGSRRTDKATLRDAATWEEIGDAENIGEKVFGLSREGFLKTLYIKSLGADSLRSDDGEIMSRLSNLETSGDEEISYSKIINSMERDIFSLKTKTGRGGKITLLEDKITELRAELSLSSMTYGALSADEDVAKKLLLASKEKENEAKGLEKNYETAQKHEKYLSSLKIQETNELLKTRLLSEEAKLKKLIKKREELSKDNEKVSAEEVSHLRALETKKLVLEQKLNEGKETAKETKKSPIVLIVTILGIICIVLGALFEKLLMISGVAVVIFGVCAFVVFSMSEKNNASKAQEKTKKVRDEIVALENEIGDIYKTYNVSVSDELSALFVSSQNRENERLQLDMQINEAGREIENLKNSISGESEEILFSKDAVEYDGKSADEIFKMLNSLKSESNQMQNRANEIMMRIAKQTAEIRTEDEILADIKNAEENKEELSRNYASLNRAYEWLKGAHDEIKSNFAPKLNQKASELMSFLTDNRYSDMRTNDEFSTNLKTASGEIVGAEYMSRGTYDLIYIALRFAAMSVLTEGKIPTIVLDDAFSQLDDVRLIKATELIDKSEEFSQVLLFTCHENYKDILNKNNILEI